MVCCELGLDEKVTRALEELGATGYTTCRGILGKGATGPKQDNAIWPGSNVVVHACVPDEMVPAIVEGVRAARDEYLKDAGVPGFRATGAAVAVTALREMSQRGRGCWPDGEVHGSMPAATGGGLRQAAGEGVLHSGQREGVRCVGNWASLRMSFC